jgi:hypothetical protein
VFVDFDDAKKVDFNGESIMGEHIDKTKAGPRARSTM